MILKRKNISLCLVGYLENVLDRISINVRMIYLVLRILSEPEKTANPLRTFFCSIIEITIAFRGIRKINEVLKATSVTITVGIGVL